jgi:hypothetical protein
MWGSSCRWHLKNIFFHLRLMTLVQILKFETLIVIKTQFKFGPFKFSFQVCEELACDIHVFPLSVRLLDLFLSKIRTPRCNLQLVGATCLHIASKLRSTQLIATETMVYYTDNSIKAADMNVSKNFSLQNLIYLRANCKQNKEI